MRITVCYDYGFIRRLYSKPFDFHSRQYLRPEFTFFFKKHISTPVFGIKSIILTPWKVEICKKNTLLYEQYTRIALKAIFLSFKTLFLTRIHFFLKKTIFRPPVTGIKSIIWTPRRLKFGISVCYDKGSIRR